MPNIDLKIQQVEPYFDPYTRLVDEEQMRIDRYFSMHRRIMQELLVKFIGDVRKIVEELCKK